VDLAKNMELFQGEMERARVGLSSVTPEEIKAHLAKITYKPGWRIFLLEDVLTDLPTMLAVDFTTEDTYNPGNQIVIGFREKLKFPIMSLEHFERQVLDALDRIERHETREWFRVEGVMKYDPHKIRERING
jgi:hypothetical protein